MSDKQIDFVEMYEYYMTQISSIEYLKKHKIDVVIGTVKQKSDAESSIVTADGQKTTLTVDCTRLQLLVEGGSSCIYMRTVEGVSDESKYYCAYFTYKDILNSGIQLSFLIWEDQARILTEMAEKQKGKILA